MPQGFDSLCLRFFEPLAHCTLRDPKCSGNLFLFPSLFMQFPSLHSSFFAPIFGRCRFFLHSSFYRIAQLSTLLLSAEIYNALNKASSSSLDGIFCKGIPPVCMTRVTEENTVIFRHAST